MSPKGCFIASIAVIIRHGVIIGVVFGRVIRNIVGSIIRSIRFACLIFNGFRRLIYCRRGRFFMPGGLLRFAGFRFGGFFIGVVYERRGIGNYFGALTFGSHGFAKADLIVAADAEKELKGESVVASRAKASGEMAPLVDSIYV